MKKAKELVEKGATLAEIENQAIAKDQVWGGEGYTKYGFDDNSVLIVSGADREYALDADDRASIEGYRDWLGEDAYREQDEIDRLLVAL